VFCVFQLFHIHTVAVSSQRLLFCLARGIIYHVFLFVFEGIISGIKAIDDEQDTQITYFFGQELTDSKTTLDEYMEKIQNVSKEDIVKVANSVTVNTIYFLKDNGTAKEDN